MNTPNDRQQDDDALHQQLIQAAWDGEFQRCVALIAQGADVNGRTALGWTALHTAATMGDLQIGRLLIEHGAEVDAVVARPSHTKSGQTPLHVAASTGNVPFIMLLIDHGANVHSKAAAGMAPLHFAAQSNHPNVCLILLENDVDVHTRNELRKTPLALCSPTFGGNRAACTLLAFGAHPHHLPEHMDPTLGVIGMEEAAARNGLTSRLMKLLTTEMAIETPQRFEVLASCAMAHGNDETAAAVRAFAAMQSMERVCADAKVKP